MAAIAERTVKRRNEREAPRKPTTSNRTEPRTNSISGQTQTKSAVSAWMYFECTLKPSDRRHSLGDGGTGRPCVELVDDCGWTQTRRRQNTRGPHKNKNVDCQSGQYKQTTPILLEYFVEYAQMRNGTADCGWLR